MSALVAALDIVEPVERAPTAAAAGRVLFDALRPYGVRGFFAGSFPKLPAMRLDDMVRGREVFAQFSPPGWQQAYADRKLDKGNPVILALGQTASPFRWSDGGVPALRGWAGLTLARELGTEDGLAVPCHRADARIGVVSMGFERFDLSPRETRALQFAALIAHERMQALNAAQAPKPERSLTPRERDCIAYVAEGYGDAEIALRLGISAGTVHTHVENAKRKLAAKTRAQAVARFYAQRLF